MKKREGIYSAAGTSVPLRRFYTLARQAYQRGIEMDSDVDQPESIRAVKRVADENAKLIPAGGSQTAGPIIHISQLLPSTTHL